MLTSSQTGKDVFYCPEESTFYSYCLETFVLKHSNRADTIVEFGSGDGSPVINALMRTGFDGTIHGFEINHLAYQTAKANAQEYEVSDKYLIYNTCFFELSTPKNGYLISNPPYIPAVDNKIYHQLLYGGTDGAEMTRRLLSLGYQNLLLMLSSYSHPEGIINYALKQGYKVANFSISPLTFGCYSSEQKVQNTISQLRKNRMAFYSKNIYLLAGVIFTQDKSVVDLSTELVQLMTSL